MTDRQRDTDRDRETQTERETGRETERDREKDRGFLKRNYKDGVVFVDHASRFVFVSSVVNFTAGKALRAKREFEPEITSI